MIIFTTDKEVDILRKHSSIEDSQKLTTIINQGVTRADEVIFLAELYWRIVDDTAEQGLEATLEKLYTSLHIHCNNEGYGDIWDNAIP